ncbi:MAG: DNA topoisomerase III, partial [Eubacterium sp.]|nr:DNA topoisomerase III [Eubacterium sp.]
MPTQYKLVITEKPSVAKAYADVLGARGKQDGYFSGNGYLISWCVGHLVELVMPQDYDEKYRKWLAEDLPIIPEKWKYRVTASTRKQFNILGKLMKRKDVKEILCATDAGREGELIFRLVYQKAGCKKPFRRIWLSSMEDAAIREAFANPRPGSDYNNLYEAARCREQADWIVGINATRLFSCLYRETLNIGRVMTPTLSMVVRREAEIQKFVPESYYVVRLTAQGTTFDSRKIKNSEEAMQLARACRAAGTAIV